MNALVVKIDYAYLKYAYLRLTQSRGIWI